MHTLSIRHEFQAAHRLPQLGGKCVNLHGHSWRAVITLSAAELPASGVLVDFGRVKTVLRGWIDEHLDHTAMLGAADPLVPPLIDAGCQVFVFGPRPWLPQELAWPTVEAVATLLAHVTGDLLDLPTRTDPDGGLHVSRVEVRETASNTAAWTCP